MHKTFPPTTAPSAPRAASRSFHPPTNPPSALCSARSNTRTHTNAFFPYKKIAEPEGDTPHLASQGSCSSSSCCRRALYPLHHISRHLARCEDSHFILLPILRATIGRQCRRILCVCGFFFRISLDKTHTRMHTGTQVPTSSCSPLSFHFLYFPTRFFAFVFAPFLKPLANRPNERCGRVNTMFQALTYTHSLNALPATSPQ